MKKKNVVKKLTMTLFTLVAVFATGLTNVNAKTTAEVNNYSDLVEKMNDKKTDIVRLTSDITLRKDLDTTFSLEMSKTLDFNGFTLTIPQQYKLKLIYYNTLDLKFINSSSSKTAKLNLLTDTGYTPIYNEIMKAEYTVNFEMDGIDIEYIKDFDSFWQTAGDYRFNNVVFKNLKVTGFHEIVDTRAYESVKFSNVTKESKNTPYKTHLINSSTLTVDDVIDADSVIEYYDREGTKIANRADKLDTIDAYWGPITVKFANSINEIRLVGDVQYGKVPAGILPAFNPGTTTDSITIDKRNSQWMYKMQNGAWSAFGSETPVANNDGKTDYGYDFAVEPKAGYQLASDLKVIYNGVDVTTTARVKKFAWGAYVIVDLGKAIGETPNVYTVTFNSNGGTEIAPKEVVSGLKIKEPSTPIKDKYLFRGWYEDSTFSKEFDFNTPITSDMTLYAKWDAANSINEIRLVGDVQKGNVPAGILPAFNPRTTTDSITINKRNSQWMYKMQNGAWSAFGSETPVANNDGKTDYGYDFAVEPKAGYQLASDLKVIYNGVDVTTTARVKKFAWGAYVIVDLGKAIGTPVVYTITFNSNDGTPVAPQNVNAGEKLTKPTPAPTKDGFTFDGWYEDSTFSKEFDFNTPITDSMTLYAKWTENKYTLTFDANGGSGTMAPIADLTGEYDLPANEFTAPTGKQFKGWSLTTDGATVSKVAMTENRTVYAIWEDIPVTTYTLTFDANGGSGTMAPIADLTGEFELPANKFTAPTGKQFKGWSLTTDGAIVNKVDMTENRTVYAIWENIPVTTYTLTFDANGGSGTMAPIADLTGEYTLPANGFTAPSGKKFKGWSLTTDGATVTKVDMTENKTVYAIWEDIIYSYEFLESTGEQTIDGKANSFKIVIDADETKFVSLEIDGVLYEKDVDYTVKHGSTIIEFTSTGLAKLNALSKGEHNVTVTFTDEVINGKITVNTVNPPIIPQNPDIDNPQTYDGIFTYIIMFVVSILGLITAVIIGKKRTRTN